MGFRLLRGVHRHRGRQAGQDAVAQVQDLVYLPKKKRFAEQEPRFEVLDIGVEHRAELGFGFCALSGSQTLMPPLRSAVASIWPFGLNATAVTQSVCFLILCCNSPVLVDQIFTMRDGPPSAICA